jgi:hypothetical protein
VTARDDNNAQVEKPGTSKLAITTAVLAAPMVGMSILRFFRPLLYVNMPCFVSLLCLLSGVVAVVLGIVSLDAISKSQGRLKGAGLALVALGVVFLSAFVGLGPGIRIHHSDEWCRYNLHTLKVALDIYSSRSNGRYPTAEKWCDLLQGYVREDKLVCTARARINSEERCSYAINPAAEPNSPSDVVLMFETSGGWNQFGGPAMLSTDNHPGMRDEFWGYKVYGCNVLFNDGRIQFVRQREFDKLRWK